LLIEKEEFDDFGEKDQILVTEQEMKDWVREVGCWRSYLDGP